MGFFVILMEAELVSEVMLIPAVQQNDSDIYFLKHSFSLWLFHKTLTVTP